MSDSVYRVTQVIGVSDESWEASGAQRGRDGAAKTVRDLRASPRSQCAGRHDRRRGRGSLSRSPRSLVQVDS